MIPELAPGHLPARVLAFLEAHGGWGDALSYVDALQAELDAYQNALYLIANGDQRPGHCDAISKARMAEIAKKTLEIFGEK